MLGRMPWKDWTAGILFELPHEKQTKSMDTPYIGLFTKLCFFVFQSLAFRLKAVGRLQCDLNLKGWNARIQNSKE
jgi:hypothetical protein